MGVVFRSEFSVSGYGVEVAGLWPDPKENPGLKQNAGPGRKQNSASPGVSSSGGHRLSGGVEASAGVARGLWGRVSAALASSTHPASKPPCPAPPAGASLSARLSVPCRPDSSCSLSGFGIFSAPDGNSSSGPADIVHPAAPRRQNSFANSFASGVPGASMRAQAMRELSTSGASGGGTVSKGFVFRDEKSGHAVQAAAGGGDGRAAVRAPPAAKGGRAPPPPAGRGVSLLSQLLNRARTGS
eukprot:scaffold19876_cov56-Isochrysis_galbana.AAC.1